MDNIFLLIFIAFIIGVLMFDLLFVGRGHHVVSIKEASVWTVVWVTLALGFFLFLRFDGHLVHGIDTFDELLHVTQKYGLSFKYDGLPLEQAMANGLTIESAINQYQHSMSIDFLSGYLIEETLSIDNLFVMLMLLTGFGVRKKDYKSVLFWGILGAIILRFSFIFLGSTLIQKFNWILLVFGAYLAYMGVKMFFKKEDDNANTDPRDHKLVKFLSKHFSGDPESKNISVEQPAGSVTCKDHHSFVTAYFGNGYNRSINEPAPTVTTDDRFALVTTKFYQNEYSGGGQLSSLDEPNPAVMTTPKQKLVSVRQYLMNPQFKSAGGSIDKPCFTLIAHMDKMPPYLITTKEGIGIAIYEDDSPMTRLIKEFMSMYGIIDICMRMLKVDELKRIMGFPSDYILIGTQSEQKKYIGNAVEVGMARQLCETLAKCIRA